MCTHPFPAGPEGESKSGLLALVMLRMIPYKGRISFQVSRGKGLHRLHLLREAFQLHLCLPLISPATLFAASPAPDLSTLLLAL